MAKNSLTAREIAEEAIRRNAAQKLAEFEPLVALVLERRPRTVVEIGTAKGGTLFAWCQAADDRATLVSIDLPGGLFGGGYSREEARRFRRFAREEQRVVTLRRNSQSPRTARRLRKLLQGRSIDFLMIDGDHTYDGVKRDWELYAPMVSDGGLIAFHDILDHPGLPLSQVDQLWRGIAPRHETLEFLAPSDLNEEIGQWGGIGVIFKDGDLHLGDASNRGGTAPGESTPGDALAVARPMDWTVYPDTPISRLPRLLQFPGLLARNLGFFLRRLRRM